VHRQLRPGLQVVSAVTDEQAAEALTQQRMEAARQAAEAAEAARRLAEQLSQQGR
jgi:hypothetical protein